jgi:hypothetical protein
MTRGNDLLRPPLLDIESAAVESEVSKVK